MDFTEFRSLKRNNLMGESRKDVLIVDFDKKLKLEFHGRKVGCKNVFSCKFSKKLSRNRKFLIAQGDFGKFIDVVRRNYVF